MTYWDMKMPPEIPGWELMGENVRSSLKYCGENVRLSPWCKIIRAENASLDDNSKIFDYVYIDAGKSLVIGKYSLLTWQVIIEGGASAHIGDRVFVGPGSKLITGTYTLNGYYSMEYIPDKCFKVLQGDIIIEDDAYIGANCVVMPGTVIKEGAVLGAGSFAKGVLEPWTVYAGSPCKPVSKREPPTEERRRVIEEMDWGNHL